MLTQSPIPVPPGPTLLLCSGNTSSSPLTPSCQLSPLHRQKGMANSPAHTLGSAHWSPHHQSQLSCAHLTSPPSPRLALAVQQPLKGRPVYETSMQSQGASQTREPQTSTQTTAFVGPQTQTRPSGQKGQ